MIDQYDYICRFLDHLPVYKETAPDKWRAPCPGHDGDDNNLAISIAEDTGRILLYCHSYQCEEETILKKMGLTKKALYPESHAKQTEASASTAYVVKTTHYDYLDYYSNLVFQVVRRDMSDGTKQIYQRQKGENGEWNNNLNRVKPILYNLPAISSYQSVIHIAEGEKCADALKTLGMAATCNPGGAGKWNDEFNKAFIGKEAVLYEDNDKQGRNHVLKIARSLHGIAKSIKVITYRDRPAKYDIADWIKDGGTREELERCIADVPEWTHTDLNDQEEIITAETLFNETEVGNAHRLHKQYGKDIRYISEFKKWAVWTGNLWRIGDADLVKRMALETVKGILHEAAEANGDRRHALIRHAYKSETARGVDAMVSLTRLLDGISMPADELDAKPWLLNVANGTVDLKTGTLREADRADMLTKQVPILFDAGAKCPAFDAFLARVVPDAETRSFLKRAVGYSLTGIVREHALFFLYGEGQNGKSTFTKVIESLLGDMWTKTRSDVLMVSRFGPNQGATPELAELKGRRLVTVTEISAGRRLDESLIKDMTGGDRISACAKYKDPITYNPTHKVWMYGNHKPDIRGTDTGIWRRVNLIPFHENITWEERDLALGDKLAAELPGILNWGLEGCLEWQTQGLGEPAEVKKATQEYRDEMDTIGLFIAAHCEAGKAYRVGSSVLYEAYKRHCADQGEAYKSHKLFTPAVKSRGYSDCRMPDSKMGFAGLRLIPIAGSLDKDVQD